MAINLTCLKLYPILPNISIVANESNLFNHQPYKPESGGLTQMISAAIARSTFSTNDIDSLLKKIFDKNTHTWNVSEITKTKPVPSIIIYISIVLGLLFSFSMTFCGVSCRKNQKKNGRKSKALQVGICLLVILYLLGIGDMIYVAYRVNKSKTSIDDTIKEINGDVYLREISEHLRYLNKKLEILDQYCTDPNSILINASKSMLIKTFNGILEEKYFLGKIVDTVNNTDNNMTQLETAVATKPAIPRPAVDLFKIIQDQYESMLSYIQLPIKEICNYTDGTQPGMDEKIREALNVIHVQLEKAMNIINNDILSEITSWENHMLMKTDLEEQIRSYINLAGTITLVLVILLAVVPLCFFLFVLLSRLCGCHRSNSHNSNRNNYRMNTVSGEPDMDEYTYRASSRRRLAPTNHITHKTKSSKTSSSDGPSRVLLCLMRIAFGLMIIIILVMALLTGVYYVLDLAIQGGCRAVHDDQSFLIDFVTERLIESDVMFVNGSEMSATITGVINDCRDNVHFSRKLLEGYWSVLDDDVADTMNTLNNNIYSQFKDSIGKMNISEDMKRLGDFLELANVTDITDIQNLVDDIDLNLSEMQKLFNNISDSNSTLSPSFVRSTIDEFKNYTRQVLELTIDGCPLPLSTISKMDNLVCHAMGSSLSGLWLSVLIFLVLVTLGLCVFGVCIYKRLDWSSRAEPPIMDRF